MTLADGFYDREGRPMTQAAWADVFPDTDYRLIDIVPLADRTIELQWRGQKDTLGGKFPFVVVTKYAEPAPNEETGFDTGDEAAAYWRERTQLEGVDFDAVRASGRLGRNIPVPGEDH
ncbi:hypothetical protein [Streptomyces sp. NBC_00470]|uniref:hypothetical protein n=1 Tax=Streptomyces sp. NBC_00470 TaxID=2975753 RepID=UPI0030DF4DFE